MDCFQSVKKLSSVLHHIDLTTFFHLRINRNGTFFILSNHKEIENYLFRESQDVGEFFSCLAKESVVGKISIRLWSDYPIDRFLKKIYTLGIGNGISLALRFTDHVDIFSFATQREHKNMTNFYLNYSKLLKRFIIYFRLKGKKIILQAESQLTRQLRIKIPLDNVKNPQKNVTRIQHFLQQAFPKKAALQHRNVKRITLTQRETEYVVRLLAGESARTIGKALGVSGRSVESCLEGIKSKIGCNTKVELLTAFLNSQIYQPSIFYERYT